MTDYKQAPSPNHSSRQSEEINGIILHYTAGGNIDGTIKWLQMPEAKCSAHYVVSRSGEIVQMVQDNRAAWHAGSSTTKPQLNGKGNLNLWTIGIEICNWGCLYKAPKNETAIYDGKQYQRQSGKFYTLFRNWTTEYKGPTPISQPINNTVLKDFPEKVIEFWEPYPEAQIKSVELLLRDLLDKYSSNITRKFIAGHSDVDPTRKLDPGPIFPYTMVDKLFINDDVFQLGKETGQLDVDFADMRKAYDSERSKVKRFCNLF